MGQQNCSERGCIFPVGASQTLSGYHIEMFASEASPSELSVEATDEDVFSAIFYDKSLEVSKRGFVSLEEHLENLKFNKTVRAAYCRRGYERHRQAGRCSCGGVRVECRKSCAECLLRAVGRLNTLRKSGLCVSCGKHAPVTGHIRCESCLDHNRTTRKAPDPLQRATAAAKPAPSSHFSRDMRRLRECQGRSQQAYLRSLSENEQSGTRQLAKQTARSWTLRHLRKTKEESRRRQLPSVRTEKTKEAV